MKDSPGITGSTNDPVFKRMAAGSTALSLAVAFGMLGCLKLTPYGLDLGWRWSALLWMTLGAAAGLILWRVAWRAEAQGSGRGAFWIYCVLFSMIGLAAFLYPIRFVAKEHLRELFFGLGQVVLAASFVAWMIYRAGKAFSNDDPKDGEITSKSK